jgi:hypothetical protein
MECSIEN